MNPDNTSIPTDFTTTSADPPNPVSVTPLGSSTVVLNPVSGGKLKRRTIKRRTVKKKSECCDATYHGLHKWFQHVFEHLGWMLLAKKRGHMEKVQVYKQSLMHLKNDLEQRIKYMKDTDRKQDLKTMHSDLLVLIEHTNKDFP